jgi:hypothetical protein
MSRQIIAMITITGDKPDQSEKALRRGHRLWSPGRVIKPRGSSLRDGRATRNIPTLRFYPSGSPNRRTGTHIDRRIYRLNMIVSRRGDIDA